MSTSPKTRPRDDEEPQLERSPKRTKIDDAQVLDASMDTDASIGVEPVAEPSGNDAEEVEQESMLPPSHAMLGAPPPVYTSDGLMQRIMETDVGISEYIGHDVPKIEGIIKQRLVSVSTIAVGVHMSVKIYRFLGVRGGSGR